MSKDDEALKDDFVRLDVVESSVDVAVSVGEVLDALLVLITIDFVLLWDVITVRVSFSEAMEV